MILLDTDHLTVLKYKNSERCIRLTARLALASTDGTPVGTTVVNVEEQMPGVDGIHRQRATTPPPSRAVPRTRRAVRLLRGFAIALYIDAAADLFAGFSAIRIKASDRKVAAVAIAHNVLLLTANKKDFEQIPGLRFENWMDP